MKLAFLSNYYSHHQKPLCDSWYRILGKDFVFVSTEQLSEERIKMGWHDYRGVPYEVYCDTQLGYKLPFDLNQTEYVILGNAPVAMVEGRLQQGKLVFKYSERIFKHGYNYIKWFPRLYTYWKQYGKYKSLYLMAASAYASADFNMHGTFRRKSYKWGYFPETKHYDLEDLFDSKQKASIVWCARFIDWKHPETAVEVARRLKAEGYDFCLEMIGSGELEEQIRRSVETLNLTDCLKFSGSMKPEEVREHMEKSQIFLFTSDFNEGWGAVLNEAMNSGCAVVASHAIGSAPYLIKHGDNGLIYQNGDVEDLYCKVKALLDNPGRQREMGEKAYQTITELWNAETAAQRFMVFSEEITKNGKCDLYEEGPCSRAPVLKNNWFQKGRHNISWIK